MSISLPSPVRKRRTLTRLTGGCPRSQFTVQSPLPRFPHRAVEMFAYQEIIRSAHRKFAGFAWLSYDIDFRRKVACSPSL